MISAMASPAIPVAPEPQWAAHPQPYTGPDPIGRAIANIVTMGAASNAHAAGQYWKGVAESYNPLHPAGALNLAGALYPGRLTSETVPYELPSSVPGIRIIRVPRTGGGYVNDQGMIRTMPPRVGPKFTGGFSPPPGMNKGTAEIAYAAVDPQGKVVGSIKGLLDPETTFINSVYVDPLYRNTTLFHDLVRPVMQRSKATGATIEASIVNPKLRALVHRLSGRSGMPRLPFTF